MNINFSKFFQKSLPFIYVIFFAYIINLALFFYLPKSGTSFILNSFSNLDYKKFGFYSNIKKLEQSDTKAINQPQDLSKYELKAIYFINSNKGWITVEADLLLLYHFVLIFLYLNKNQIFYNPNLKNYLI
jgi:general secretion pathway protein C